MKIPRRERWLTDGCAVLVALAVVAAVTLLAWWQWKVLGP